MKKIEGLSVSYLGYQKPQSNVEVELEILGLETAITAAKQRIAVLKQSMMLQGVMKESSVEDASNEKTVEKASESEKTE